MRLTLRRWLRSVTREVRFWLLLSSPALVGAWLGWWWLVAAWFVFVGGLAWWAIRGIR